MIKEYELINNEKKHQYEFQIGGYTPKIEYIISKNSEIFFTHTEVPIALEGQGIGSLLVKKTLQDAERLNLKVVPLCPFVAAYINRNPEWKKNLMTGVNL